jgi:hypothetical protein
MSRTERSTAVPAPQGAGNAERARIPATTGNPSKIGDAGGGTRTPDTRIMIPLL